MKRIVPVLLSSLLILPALHAQEITSLDELLAAHLAAIGGKTEIHALHSSKLVYNVSIMVISGSYTEYSKAPLKSRSEFDSPVLKQVEGYDGNVDWTLDANNNLELEPRPSLPFSEYSLVLPEYQFLFRSPDIEMTFRGLDEGPFGQEYAISIQRGEEPERTLYFDRENHLVTRMAVAEKGIATEMRFNDYKPVNGILVAHSMTQVVDYPGAQPVIFQLESAEFNLDLDDTLFSPPVGLRETITFTNPAKSIELPIDILSGHIFVPVSINGSEPISFLLDTGAGKSILSLSLARKLEIEEVGTLQSVGVGGEQDVSAVMVDSMALPGLLMKEQLLYATDLEAFTPFLGRTVGGVLGYDFFNRLVVCVDYEKERMTITDPAIYLPPQQGEEIPLELVMNIPEVKGTIAGSFSGNLRIDTGSNGALHLHSPFVVQQPWIQTQKSFAMQALGVGGETIIFATRIKTLSLGSFQFLDIPADFSTEPGGALGVGGSIATIGGRILSQFRVTLDYPHKRMILEPAALFGQPIEVDKTGMVFVIENGEYMVTSVYPDTPACRAGLLEGDILLKISGTSLVNLPMKEVRELLHGPDGRKIKMKVRRDGQTRRIRFLLQSYY